MTDAKSVDYGWEMAYTIDLYHFNRLFVIDCHWLAGLTKFLFLFL